MPSELTAKADSWIDPVIFWIGLLVTTQSVFRRIFRLKASENNKTCIVRIYGIVHSTLHVLFTLHSMVPAAGYSFEHNCKAFPCPILSSYQSRGNHWASPWWSWIITSFHPSFSSIEVGLKIIIWFSWLTLTDVMHINGLFFRMTCYVHLKR